MANERNIIKVARANKAALEILSSQLSDYELVFAVDTKELGVKSPETGNIHFTDVYFKHDGTEAMTGDLDLDNHDLKNIKSLKFKNQGSVYVASGDKTVLFIDDIDEISLEGSKLTNIGAPANDQDAATKKYVDDYVVDIDFSDYLQHNGSVKFTADQDANGRTIKNIKKPVEGGDAVNKTYVDDITVAPDTNKVNIKFNTDITKVLPAATRVLAGVMSTGNQTIGGQKTFEGNIVIEGDLAVQGDNFIAETTTVRTEDDVIELRSKGQTAITTPAGLVVKKYDGTNDGAIVIKSDGEVRVGKVTLDSSGKIEDSASNAQPVLTRNEKGSMADNNILVWEGSNNRAITKSISDLGIALDSVLLAHTTNENNPHGVTKTQVGLGNADNTADVDKSVLEATKWKTARTLTIGSTGKPVNGTANVSWSLSEIGAAPAVHNHGSYDRLAGGLTGANVFSDIVISKGIVTGTTTRALTKSDLGLGSVQNYGVATKAEAQAGALDTKYMTPQKTFDAIAISIIDGGNLADLL